MRLMSILRGLNTSNYNFTLPKSIVYTKKVRIDKKTIEIYNLAKI